MKSILIPVVIYFLAVFNLISDDVAPESLVAHWTFDNDASGIVYDASGNNYNGEYLNVSYNRGAVGKAVIFNSPDDRIFIPSENNVPPSQIGNLSQGSISLWFKYQDDGSQVLPILYFGESSSEDPHNSLIIEIGHDEDINNRKLYFTIVNQNFCFDSGENLIAGQWYHFVAIVRPDGNTGYLNGKEMTNRHYNLGSDISYSDFFNDVPAKEMMSIGYGRYGKKVDFNTFNGAIDDIRIYNRSLTEDEILELYSMGNVETYYPPTYENISYGPDSRNVLDFWKAESETPTPVVVFIHGGSFKSGDKSQARVGTTQDYINWCLDNAVSFAAINYRFRMTTRIDSILIDCARAIQFLRYKSDEWNIDKNKFAAFGSSAGGGAAIWIAWHDDLADPDAEDPVLKESTRLTVVGHLNSQSTYDFQKWPAILGVSENWMTEMNTTDDLDLYHIDNRNLYDSPEIIELRKYVDMPSFLDNNDPPCYFQNSNPDADPRNSNSVIHHPKHAIYLKSLYDNLGLESFLDVRTTPANERIGLMNFILPYLIKGYVGVQNKITSEIGIDNSPNPFELYTTIRFYLPAAAHVNIKVYNLLGYEVKTLKDGFCTQGLHEVVFFADGLDSGIYLCVMQSDFNTQSIKLVLTK